MVCARFYAVGDTGSWLKDRIQEEIQTSGIEGNMTHVDTKTLAVIVEGDIEKVSRLYKNLQDSSPDEIQFTDIEYRKQEKGVVGQDDLTSSINTLIEIMREVEKNTRKLNQKLDRLTATGINIEKEDTHTPASSNDYGWSSYEDDRDEEEKEEEATCGFAGMFGDF